MNAEKIRQTFFDFFESKNHKIVPSAPMVVKNDPTLMFTNAGMNQFKDVFLGNQQAVALRVADTQKCLRVSGKHNDLEEVGHDTYHHTMFEMLGNWSFGDYFKEEAIAWAWELLVDVYGINKDDLYVTVFGGEEKEGLERDFEAGKIWKKFVDGDRILDGNKKDNFWEMGDTGPCGPCSEIHVDLRSEEEKAKIPGRDMVNRDHPEVIELWNLVFIQFNRKADGTLENLPQKHVDTGMGFERLCMVLQKKKSNYDTDVFMTIIRQIENLTGIEYGKNRDVDVAMRVVSDHLRAVAFGIGDGQIPSNVKAGYVIRRILRRAIRYAYTFLDRKEPFMFLLIPVFIDKMGSVFPEIKAQQSLIEKVMHEEEHTFLRTLEQGIKKFEQYLVLNPKEKVINGKFAFELFDTYGFPLDLTQLMAREQGLEVDVEGFNMGMEQQKQRSRNAAQKETEDWIILEPGFEETQFFGYDHLELEVEIVKYRKVKDKKTTRFQLVFDRTPFYAESGGQIGDTGFLIKGDHKIQITDTQKENELIIHLTSELPEDLEGKYQAVVDTPKRIQTANNHSATHLMHAALRKILGTHVEQKGSLVDSQRLRFDFTHFSKMSKDELRKVEEMVNEKVRENIFIEENKHIPLEEAKKMGAMALFGEKYGEEVRVISFDKSYSVELCGGTHVTSTGQIGFFKIISEGAIAAGIRRIEAVTGKVAEEVIYEQQEMIDRLKDLFKNKKDLVEGVESLFEENNLLQKEVKSLKKEKASAMKDELLKGKEQIQQIDFIGRRVDLDADTMKDLIFSLLKGAENLIVVLGAVSQGKPQLMLMISQDLVKKKGLNAGNIIREIAKEIKGGGGGQPHFATAGGKDSNGIESAIQKTRELLN